MASFNIPASPPTYEANLTDFLGVDFSSSISEIDKRRSPIGYNFINNNGTIEKRNGYKVLATLSGNINGVWNVDSARGEKFVVHCGTKLYEFTTDFSQYYEVKTGLADHKSQGVIVNSKLIILDGTRAISYDLTNNSSVSPTNWAKFLDEDAHIPTTQIARSPNGLKSQTYESANVLTNKRINLFTSNTSDTDYILDDIVEVIEGNAQIHKVEVLDSNGEWKTKEQGTDYTVVSYTENRPAKKPGAEQISVTTYKVVFSSPVGAPVVDDKDNVKITYTVSSTYGTTVTNKSQINNCTLACAYGYGGANNRVFISGNINYKNTVMYSDIDNITYFPVENIINCGIKTIPINGLIRLVNGHLAALKDRSDSDSTLFELGFSTFNGIEAFPLLGSSEGEGNIAQFAHDTLINEPLILSNNGVFSVNSSTLRDDIYVYHKSYYIDAKLKKEPNLKNAVGIVNDGKYYLAINNHVYVADSRFKTTNKNSKYSNYQYEWFYWTGIPVRTWFAWNNKLYFGDNAGHICTFREDDDPNRFKDIDVNVEAEWNSIILDLSSVTRKKNIKRITIQSNPTNSKLVVGYRLNKGEKEVLTKIYTDSTYPKATVIRKKAKKLSFFSLYIENKENENMCFNTVCVVYTVGSYYKGD